jgi:hypothetical protein
MSTTTSSVPIAKAKRKLSRVLVYALIIPVLVIMLCCAAFGCWLYWTIVRPIDQFDRSIQDAWRPFSKWEILDAAMKSDLASKDYTNGLPLPVPLSQQVEFHLSDGSSLQIVYGGGFHHCGIIYYPDQRQLEDALRHVAGSNGAGDAEFLRLHDKLLFFKEK